MRKQRKSELGKDAGSKIVGKRVEQAMEISATCTMYIIVLVGVVDLFVRTPLLRKKLTETKTQESLLTGYSYR